MVSIGGLGGVSNDSGADSRPAVFLENVLKNGGGDYFDVFEFKQHHHSAEMYKEIGVRYNTYEKILSDYGKDIDLMPVFLETAMYSSNVAVDHFPIFPELPPQTENEQAGGLIKTYVYSVALGVDIILWNLLFERHNFGNSETNIFNFYGLINNPENTDGLSHKKLSYYTYKLMVEELEGSDWDNIQTIQESDNVYIYKFTKQGNPIWVAWWDYFEDTGSSKTIPLDIGDINSVKITEAVPNVESGNDLNENDYPDFFKTETKAVNDGEITISLGESPVFIEELSTTSIEETGGITPNKFRLNQNYPNPFNPQTTISYQLPVNGDVALKIYNMLGQEVCTLINENKPAGYHSVVWNGIDNSGRQVSSGVYFYQVKAGNNFSEINKMLLIK